MKNPLDTNLEVWILDNDQRLHNSYKKILNLRYRTRFFFSLEDFAEAFYKESYRCSFLIAELIVLALIAFVPAVTLYLPRLAGIVS